MQTNILIFLPMAGAIAVWIVPWGSRRAAGGFALLVALAELAFWIGTALNFDFGTVGLQAESEREWFADLGVAYKVGLYDYSLWLVGLTAVVTTAAIAYGFWAGREREGAYLSLLLFLEGATIGVFTAQDLVLFYVFWEAMLIPIYVLIGVWGGAGRLGATVKFVIYTIAGSLLMLVAIVLAAMYMLRLISAVLHENPGSAVPAEALDLRPAEVGIIVPLVAILLVLSFWPAAVTERVFGALF